jgi:hypothetical protein
MMLDWNAQLAKLKENFDALFVDLNIEPLLKGVRQIAELFGQSTESGQALKQLMTMLLRPLIGDVAEATPIMRRFMQGMIIAAQDLVIAYLDVRIWWRKTFGTEQTNLIDKTTQAVKLGRLAVWGFGVALGIAVGAATLLLSPLIAIGLALYNMGRGLMRIWDGFGELYDLAMALAPRMWEGLKTSIATIIKLWGDVDWRAMGVSLIQGLVGGLTGEGLLSLKRAVEDLADSGLAAFQKKLGIASPSKVFAELGLAIPEGVTQGVKAGTPEAQHAILAIGKPPSIPAAPSSAPASRDAASGGGKSRGGGTVVIEQLNVQASGDTPKEFAADIKRELESLLEGVALQLGAPIAGAP